MKKERKRLEEVDNSDDEWDRVKYKFVDEKEAPQHPKVKWPKKPKDDEGRGFGAYPDQLFKPHKKDKTMRKQNFEEHDDLGPDEDHVTNE